MFRVSNSVYLRDKRLNDEYYDIKYNQVNRIDLRKCADFTNETPEQATDNNFTPPAPPSPSAPPVQTNDYNNLLSYSHNYQNLCFLLVDFYHY